MTRATQHLVAQLVTAVLDGREDARVLRKVLRVQLETAIADFERYHDARHARNRIVDHDILMARDKAARQKART